jgi:hypothetical protein
LITGRGDTATPSTPIGSQIVVESLFLPDYNGLPSLFKERRKGEMPFFTVKPLKPSGEGCTVSASPFILPSSHRMEIDLK